jgi:prolyl oligopeptidase
MTTSFVSPTRILRLREDTELFESAGEDAKDVIVERVDARSKDGTRVFMFVVRKRDQALPAPVLVNGYGGFNVNQTPAYSVRALAAVERGLVFVSTVIRGGGELGEAWHEAGMLDRKQNVFDDFIACTEELSKRGIAAPGKIAAIGGSNGGLLVAAVCVQRPDLYRVGISLVPLADMLRYHLFRIGRLWIPEYGDPDKQEHFRFLYAYSPYHHVRAGVRYPSMLFATAEADSRVDPMHARKMAARMQEVAERPVLLRVEEKAGHGQGKPASKVGEEVADELAFVLEELG